MLFQPHTCLSGKKTIPHFKSLFLWKNINVNFSEILVSTVSIVSCTEKAPVDLQLLTFISLGHKSWSVTFWCADCEGVGVDPLVTF